ncbi:hypothetical protein [Nocardia cerradoensis]|uniref:DUF8020 domain-containing protein n=1 Tax=Nocardia cerradoensis TaxID=85688 RepID=A0A231GYX1_9NOCA|nr:hypothetical protein [Nocardia cerradoensis]NKY46274.1 hypothetical protein [Nocardia cerradoensis]OXR41806.1 hypothetical protein B7C42_06148 [Nocardia cerradoensis]
MKIRISTIAAVCAATLAAAGTAAADPAPAVVSYHAETTDSRSVTVELTHGTFAVDPDGTAVTIRDEAGRALYALPLAYAIGDQRMPIREQIGEDATTLTLTPDTAGVRRDALTPVASPLENQLAMNDLVNAVSIGTSVGALIGTAVGAVLGVGLGIALAGASCAVLSVACVVAVLPIVSLAGAAGGVAGLVLGGGPTTAVGLYRYVTTLLAPPGTSEYASDLRGRPGVPDTGR